MALGIKQHSLRIFQLTEVSSVAMVDTSIPFQAQAVIGRLRGTSTVDRVGTMVPALLRGCIRLITSSRSRIRSDMDGAPKQATVVAVGIVQAHQEDRQCRAGIFHRIIEKEVASLDPTIILVRVPQGEAEMGKDTTSLHSIQTMPLDDSLGPRHNSSIMAATGHTLHFPIRTPRWREMSLTSTGLQRQHRHQRTRPLTSMAMLKVFEVDRHQDDMAFQSRLVGRHCHLTQDMRDMDHLQDITHLTLLLDTQ